MTTGARVISRAVDIRRQSLLAAGAVALAVVAAWSAGWLASDHAPSKPAESTRAPAPEIVSLRLAAYPAHAVLYLDEHRLPANPSVVEHAADGSSHVLRAEAPGHHPAFRVMKVRGHVDLTLRLDPISTVSPAPTAAPAPTHHRQSPAAPKPASAPTASRTDAKLPVGKAAFASPSAPATSATAPGAKPPKVNIDTANPW